MLLRDLSKVYISRASDTNDHGEYTKTWQYVSFAFLNMQQDLDELDRKTSGEIDYSIYKARTDKSYDIQKGDGISLSDISQSQSIVPDYRVMNINKIGNTYIYRLEKYNEN